MSLRLPSFRREPVGDVRIFQPKRVLHASMSSLSRNGKTLSRTLGLSPFPSMRRRCSGKATETSDVGGCAERQSAPLSRRDDAIEAPFFVSRVATLTGARMVALTFARSARPRSP